MQKLIEARQDQDRSHLRLSTLHAIRVASRDGAIALELSAVRDGGRSHIRIVGGGIDVIVAEPEMDRDECKVRWRFWGRRDTKIRPSDRNE